VKIYLVRHGEAAHPAVDPRRPLSDGGRCEVEQVSKELASRGVKPTWVAHSPKARAVETAEILGRALAPAVELEVREDLLPLGPVDDVAVELSVRSDGDGMLVGHMPFQGDLAAILLGPKLSDYPQFPTAGVMCLERTPEGDWELQWMIGP
jgi:phosphohistidine phosphatase